MLQNHVFKIVQKDILRIIYNKHVMLVKEDAVLVRILPIVSYVIAIQPFGSNSNVSHSVLH